MKPHGIPDYIERRFHCSIEPVGSRYTVNPEPTGDSDHDYLVLIGRRAKSLLWDDDIEQRTKVAKEFCNSLVSAHGWRYGGSMDAVEGTQFFTLRNDEGINLIVTGDPSYYRSFKAATHVCRVLNLKDKAQRIMVFEAVQYHRINGVAERDWLASLDTEVVVDPFAETNPHVVTVREAQQPTPRHTAMVPDKPKRKRVIDVV